MAIPILWRTTKERYSLQGEVCPECDKVVFPPRRLCPYCGRQAGTAAPEAETKRYGYSFVLPHAFEGREGHAVLALSAAGDD